MFKCAGGDTSTCACISRQTGRSSVAQEVKRWSAVLAVPCSSPAGSRGFPDVNGVPLCSQSCYNGIHYNSKLLTNVLLICTKRLFVQNV